MVSLYEEFRQGWGFLFKGLLIGTFILASGIFSNPAAFSEEAQKSPNRYSFIGTKNGLVRVDKVTGQVDRCRVADIVKCQAILDGKRNEKKTTDRITEVEKKPPNLEKPSGGRQALKTPETLKAENDRLKTKIMELKQKIADLENEISLKNDGASGLKERPQSKMKLPSDEDVDAAIDYVERMIKKLRGAIKKFQEEDQLPRPQEEREL